MSHAPHDWVRAVVKNILARISSELGIVTGILLDTQGPAIRTGDLETKLNLKPGDIFDFTVRGESERGRALSRCQLTRVLSMIFRLETSCSSIMASST